MFIRNAKIGVDLLNEWNVNVTWNYLCLRCTLNLQVKLRVKLGGHELFVTFGI